MCDENRGLSVNKACTRSSDTVCGPLKGFYCPERNKGSCTFAVKHSECSPGQYIKQAGTGSTDTVCADCEGDTYSNGSFSSCLPHTKCEALGLTETNPGTKSSDSECGNPPALAIIISSVIVTLILITVVSVLTIIYIRKKKHPKHSGIQETGNYLNEKVSTKVVGGRTNAETFRSEEQVLSLQIVNDLSSQTTQQEFIMPEVKLLEPQTVLETN